jgi:hypothetical protein
MRVNGGRRRCHKCRFTKLEPLDNLPDADAMTHRNIVAKRADPEYQKHVSDGIKKKWQDPDFRARVSKNSRKWDDPEWAEQELRRRADPAKAEMRKLASIKANALGRDKIIAKAKAKWKDPAYVTKQKASTPARSAKTGAASKARWEDPEFRARMAIVFNDADYVIEVSERVKAVWTDEYRARHDVAHTTAMKSDRVRKVVKDGMASPEVRKKLSDSTKRAWKDPKFQELQARCRAAQLEHVSGPQKQLYAVLRDLGVNFHEEGVNTAIGYYAFDCMVPLPDGKRLLIEVQGDYWHSDKVKGAVARDAAKFTYIERYFPDCSVLYIWEHEFDAVGKVHDRLKQRLGMEVSMVDFDTVDVKFIKHVPQADVKRFLSTYHYIGKTVGIVYGAYLGEELIATCQIKSLCRSPNADMLGLNKAAEMSRLCVHPFHNTKLFVGWFIAACLEAASMPVIIYLDTLVDSIDAYAASGFKFHHEVAPDYWYQDKDGFVMHRQTMHRHAKGSKMTESEFAITKGYFQRHGSKKLCYVHSACILPIVTRV